MPDPSKKYVITPRASDFVEVRMAKADWDEIQDVLATARSMIRDVAHDWPVKELAEAPEETVVRITALLEDGYDFDSGETADERDSEK